jgi:DNA-binding beta-propeller fold protein YncE
MDNLLTDQGDPEKRIADLEHHLAEQRRGADLPATSRSFVASAAPLTTKQMMKYTHLFSTAAIALIGALEAAVVLVGAIVDSHIFMQVGGAVVFFSFLLLAMPAYGAFQRRLNREKKVPLRVASDGLTADTRPGDVFSLSDAQLGRWTPEGYRGMTKGTALHLRCGEHRFILGGRDHQVATETSLEAPPVDSIDAWMWAAEFDELLDIVLGRPRQHEVGSPTPGGPTRYLLIPNPMRSVSSSIFGIFKNTAAALRLNADPPQPSLAIDVAEDAISVVDLKRDAVIASAPVAEATATPVKTTRSMPYVGTYTTPALVVRVPNAQPISIGCPAVDGPPQATWSGRTNLNQRFSWRADVPRDPEPQYVVSDKDWLTLIDTFGLAADLEDKAKAGTEAGKTPLPDVRPTAKRPRAKLLVLAVIGFFVITPIIWIPAMIVMNRHHEHDTQLTADRERPFALPFTGLRLPHSVAVDGAGNVYVAENRTNQVIKLAADSRTQTVLPFTGLDLFWGGAANGSIDRLAVDAAGNVYVGDQGHNRVVKLAAGSNTQSVLPFSALGTPHGVAVDTAGSVYVVDSTHEKVLKLAAGSNTQSVLPPFGRWVSPSDVAVDAAGNVYVTASVCPGKSCRSYVVKLAPGSNSWAELPSLGREQHYVAVDPAGNVYVIKEGGGVMKLAPGSKNWTEVPGGHRFVDPLGLAVDARGNVYVTDHTGSRDPGQNLPFGLRLGEDESRGYVLKLPAG